MRNLRRMFLINLRKTFQYVINDLGMYYVSVKFSLIWKFV